jgi:Tfp pilus assembly protein PilF
MKRFWLGALVFLALIMAGCASPAQAPALEPTGASIASTTTSPPTPTQSTPDDEETYLNRGLGYLNEGDYDQAISEFDAAIRLNPDCAEAYTQRGLAYNLKGDYYRAFRG